MSLALPGFSRRPRGPFGDERMDPAHVRALQAGPWVWPQADTDGFTRASALATYSGPGPGQGLLVAVNDTCASLWSLEIGHRKPHAVSFDGTALRALDGAALALPRSLPVLWRSVREARGEDASAILLGILPRDGCFGVCDPVLRGTSFGLAFLLALASRVLGRGVPETVAAVAELDDSGLTTKVDSDGLVAKLTALAWLTPRVTTVLVAATQEEEARGLVDRYPLRLEVKGIHSGAAALELIYKDLGSLLVDAGKDDKHEIVTAFFDLSLSGPRQVHDWTPVASGAEVAAANWYADLTQREQWQLAFARAVALRHQANLGELPQIDNGLLREFPAPVRVEIASHYVQQAADTGKPEVKAARQLADAVLVQDVGEGFGPHLKLMGALARLLAIAGDPRGALTRQQEVAHAFFALRNYADVSFQLSEWYRLAGALADESAFQAADDMATRVEQRGGLGWYGSLFVDLARAKGLVNLERQPEAKPTFERVASERQAKPSLLWSARRWLVRLASPADGKALMKGWSGSAPAGSDSKWQRVCAALVHLDRALADSNAGDAGCALEELRAADSGPVNVLTTNAPSGSYLPAYVQQFYPY